MSRLSRVKNHLLNHVLDVTELFADDVEIYRRPCSTAVMAACHHPDAESLLKRCGFEQSPLSGRQFHLPQHLPEAEKKARATRAALSLVNNGYAVDFDESLRCPNTHAGFTAVRRPAASVWPRHTRTTHAV